MLTDSAYWHTLKIICICTEAHQSCIGSVSNQMRAQPLLWFCMDTVQGDMCLAMVTGIDRVPLDVMEDRQSVEWKMDVMCQHIECLTMERCRMIALTLLSNVVFKGLVKVSSAIIFKQFLEADSLCTGVFRHDLFTAECHIRWMWMVRIRLVAISESLTNIFLVV